MYRIWLVDFENVQKNGLAGISKLTADDHVVIFYSGKPAVLQEIKKTAAKHRSTFFEFYQAKKTAKNYLDFQLVTYAGFIIGNTDTSDLQIVIVTRDRGYDAVVDFWKQYGVNIRRQETIAGITVDEAASKVHKKAGISEREMAHLRKEMKKQLSFVEISDFTNKYRKKIKSAIKDNETTSADITRIYEAAVLSENDQEYKEYITGVIPGSKGKEIYGKTVKIVKVYRSKRAV